MATTEGPASGADFWVTLGVGEEDDEASGVPQDGPTPEAPVVAANLAELGVSRPPLQHAESATAIVPAPGTQSASAQKPASGKRINLPPKKASAHRTVVSGSGSGTSLGTPTSFGQLAPAQDSGPKDLPDPQAEWAAMFSGWKADSPNGTEGMSQAPALAAPADEAEGDLAAEADEAASEPERREAGKALNASVEPGPPSPDPGWHSAERLASEIRSRLSELWFELLVSYAGGDRSTAYKIYHVLGGQHLLGELWMDKRISEVHIRGTRVTVCGADGMYDVPGFPSLATAARAVETVTNARDKWGAVVTYAGESVVLSRSRQEGPGVEALLASGVVTEQQLSGVRQALQRMQAVTIAGPAARVVMRAFASLIPSGSRVFEGPFAVLPAGCMAATSPLDADYVIGVRPGATAEDMAAAGQVGALIANPETRFRAAVQLVVSGPSAAPEKIAAH
jgi:hypothetical protein